MIDPFYLKVGDQQPYYYVQVFDSKGIPIDITGYTIKATMKSDINGTIKIDHNTSNIYITDPLNGMLEYRWGSNDTDTVGKYFIVFEFTPSNNSGRFTLPMLEKALVIINS